VKRTITRDGPGLRPTLVIETDAPLSGKVPFKIFQELHYLW